MAKGYRIVRQSPTDLDDSGSITPSLEFDYTHVGGAAPWPVSHGGVKFGPSIIKAAWKAGFVVIAYVEGFPNPVAVTEGRWNEAHCLEVKTLEGFRLPTRLRSVPPSSALKSTGEYVEP